jgi:hypothetical protein
MRIGTLKKLLMVSMGAIPTFGHFRAIEIIQFHVYPQICCKFAALLQTLRMDGAPESTVEEMHEGKLSQEGSSPPAAILKLDQPLLTVIHHV